MFILAAKISAIHGNFYDIPILNWAAADPTLSNAERFPTMIRMIGSSNGSVKLLLNIIIIQYICISNNDPSFGLKDKTLETV